MRLTVLDLTDWSLIEQHSSSPVYREEDTAEQFTSAESDFSISQTLAAL